MNLESDEYGDEEDRYATSYSGYTAEKQERDRLQRQRQRAIAVNSDFNRYLIGLFNEKQSK